MFKYKVVSNNLRFRCFCKFLLFLIFNFTFLIFNCLYATDLDSGLKKTVKQFGNVFKLYPDLKPPVPIAIFPFQCEKKLAEKRAGVAVAEILMHQFKEGSSFKIVERMELERILEEQKLSLTGIIATDKAVQVGQMLGAKLLVTGNINRIGNSYQISSRLVNSETSEVLVTDLLEVSVEVFEQETASYQVYVPEKQAIGVYILGMNYPFSIKTLPEYNYSNQTYNSHSYSMRVHSGDADASSQIPYGFGGRYWFLKWAVIDAAFLKKAFSVEENEITNLVYRDISVGYGWANQISITTEGSMIKGSIAGTYNISKSFRGFAGYGMSIYSMDLNVEGSFSGGWSWATPYPWTSGQTVYTDQVNFVFSLLDEDGNVIEADSTIDPNDRYSYQDSSISHSFSERFNIPFIKLGMEWRAQSRLGVALFYNYNLQALKKTYNLKMTVTELSAQQVYDSSTPATTLESTSESYIIPYFEIEMPKSSIELTVSLYF
ncbi:MAG TPA: hypothetical protein DCP53_08050 [Elusimicrobia bacterium]|nr:hypothetical protein [Elusimicrobiota bacterium]